MKSMTICRPLALLALGLLLLTAGVVGAWGAEPKAPPKKEKEEFPLHITAARLEADQNQRIITFIGQVKAQQGDSILYADQLRVYYLASPAPPAGKGAQASAKPDQKAQDASPLGDLGGEKIDRIVATGQVRFVQEDKVATGQEAIYYKNRDEVVLLGNPQLWRGENNLKGERIVFNLKDNRVVVDSSPQKRVEANLYPAGQKGETTQATKIALPGTKTRKPGRTRSPQP
jgi:lipopolysaccharide export system protein LptA